MCFRAYEFFNDVVLVVFRHNHHEFWETMTWSGYGELLIAFPQCLIAPVTEHG